MKGITLEVDSLHGVYVPQVFHDKYDITQWDGILQDDWDEISNPDNEFYWEAWENILNDAYDHDSNGHIWRLHQDGDLWAYCEDLMSEEDKLTFFGE